MFLAVGTHELKGLGGVPGLWILCLEGPWSRDSASGLERPWAQMTRWVPERMESLVSGSLGKMPHDSAWKGGYAGAISEGPGSVAIALFYKQNGEAFHLSGGYWISPSVKRRGL